MTKPTTPAQRETHKSNWSASGLSKKAYCQSVGINYGTFISWFKSASAPVSSGRFIALAGELPTYSTQIVLPNGIELTTTAPLSSALLKTLYHV